MWANKAARAPGHVRAERTAVRSRQVFGTHPMRVTLPSFTFRPSRLSLRPVGTTSVLMCLVALFPSVASACATCGCTLSTDAATGYSTTSGWRLNVDYTFIDQDQLRHGSSKASPQQVVEQPSDPSLGGGEIEKQTVNRYINLSATYRFNADWGVT